MKLEATQAYFTRASAPFSLNFSAKAGIARPIVWSIAGSDSGGGAGLQADLKAFAAFGVHGCTAVAAITAQNSVAVTRVEAVSAELLNAQLAALAQDMPPQAIKTGLLGNVENLRLVCRWIDYVRERAHAQGLTVPLVVDPVLAASTGAGFADDALVQAYVQELLPRATLVTPNRAEAQRLGLAANQTLGPVSVVITGGDASQTNGMASDWLSSPQATGWLSLPRVDTAHQHGTGCTFAATAAAALASGYCVADAVVLAKMATMHALRHGYAAGQGAGPVNAQADFAQQLVNLPALSPACMATASAFRPLRDPALGVYAVVDSAAWVRRVLAAGIRTVQLRIKDPHDPTLPVQIQESIAAANATPGAQLFINDHWQLALQHGAYGVHLGQEDLDAVDLKALRQAGVRLGISTHSYWEVCRAWALRPSYIACGPIFATQSKDMPWVPQGLGNLRYWAALLPIPVVGIAGINVANVAEVAATGAAGAAVIAAVTGAQSPLQACQALIAAFAHGQTLPRTGLPLRAKPTV
ncbi:MAG: bifunctional hydroxymethylpyrimidine kinase/phosphomethylpyrimidine kinase [Rhodoferax sp.]